MTLCSIKGCQHSASKPGRYRFCVDHWKAELARREVNRLAMMATRPHWKGGRHHKEQHA